MTFLSLFIPEKKAGKHAAEAYDVQEKYLTILAELLKVAEEVREDLGDDITKREGKNRRPNGKVE